MAHDREDEAFVDAGALINALSLAKCPDDLRHAWDLIDGILAGDRPRETMFALGAVANAYFAAWTRLAGSTPECARESLALAVTTKET